MCVITLVLCQGCVVAQVPGSLGRFFKDNGYTIGGAFYSMDDIEHGVLRCNAEHPTTKSRYFQPGDSRLHAVMAELDPRIHFAVVCAPWTTRFVALSFSARFAGLWCERMSSRPHVLLGKP